MAMIRFIKYVRHAIFQFCTARHDRNSIKIRRNPGVPRLLICIDNYPLLFRVISKFV